jgi:hypothetical protein
VALQIKRARLRQDASSSEADEPRYGVDGRDKPGHDVHSVDQTPYPSAYGSTTAVHPAAARLPADAYVI